MNINWSKIAKVVIPVASIAATAATNWLNKKEFDEKVTQKVQEVLAESNGKES